MNEQIDWSKAPEDAMVLLKHVRDGAYAVSESYGDEAKTWHWPDPRYSFPLMPSMWRIVAERSATPSWSGEGMPPVGTVCERRFIDSDDEKWSLMDVLCHGKTTIYYRDRNGTEWSHYINDLEFRPIRTPEQIAADEREKMANMLWQRYLQPILAPAQEAQVKAALGLIYDDFYRKEQK